MTACPSCGERNPERARFCLACGTPLTPAVETAREERKVVTVLFADLVGFTGSAEKLDPEDVRALLSPYYARLRAELERFGGTVEKFIGDAVMAVFGAPVAHEDDPERAVRAAFAIREALADDEGELHVRIGITTGEALVALGARPVEGEGMVSGDVVNTAARLQSAAPVDGIVVDETTYRATERRIVYRDSQPVSAKGKMEPVLVREAVEPRSRLGVDMAQQVQASLVGRERELGLLLAALERARSERSVQLVTLVGVPGIGKSRLVWELSQVVEKEAELVYWRQGRSLPYGEGITFWALAEMTKAHAGILETDSAETAREKLREAVAEALPDAEEARWVESHLAPLVGVGPGQEGSFGAWRRFFEALAEHSPLVLVFEDLHWADDGLLDFVDHLVDWAVDVPLLVVCTARPELLGRRPGWGGGKTNAVTASLSPLGEADVAQLLGVLLERPLLPAEMQSELLARAGGNPLYAEEYARMLAERGDDADLPLPESVQGIITARLDALSPSEKELMHDAAVLGKVFWLGALVDSGPRERSAVEELLHGLERREFVRRERRPSVAGETEYAFRHLLVRDVAYGQIPRPQRAEKHLRAAAWIESLARDRTEDRAEMLGHHYLAALEFTQATGGNAASFAERARGALRQAGDRAATLHGYEQALRFYAAALELWPAEDADRGALLLEYGRALTTAHVTGEDVLAEAAALLAAERPGLAAEAEILLGELRWKSVDSESASRHLRRAEALVEKLPPSPSKAFVVAQLARFRMLAGEHEGAERLGSEALAMAEELELDDLVVHALNSIGSTRSAMGNPGGIDDLERAIAFGLERNSPEAGRAYINLAVQRAILGDVPGARRSHEEGMRVARRFGHEGDIRWLEAEIAIDCYLLGEWSDALRGAESFIETRTPHYMESGCRWIRAEILMARGRTRRALEEGREGLVQSRRARDPQNLYASLTAHVLLLHTGGETVEAAVTAAELLAIIRDVDEPGPALWYLPLAHYLDDCARSSELAELGASVRDQTPWGAALAEIEAGDLAAAADRLGETGAVAYEAFARLRAGERLVAEGRVAEGEEQLARALAFYREVGATAYVARAEALLAASA